MRTRILVTTLAGMLGLAGPVAAQGPPAVTTGPPTVDGDYVNLSGSISSSDNCALGTSCPGQYVISAAPLPPTAGYLAGSLFWTNSAQPQQLPLIINMRSIRKAFTFPPNTTTYTVVLAATYAPSQVAYGSAQTFTWPSGQLSLGSVDLLGAESPRLAYRLNPGRTPFRSAAVTATISSPSGQRLGSFRDRAEPGQNLARPPSRLASRLQPGSRYRVALRASDEFNRKARRSGVVRF
jgi:hypothetical protein